MAPRRCWLTCSEQGGRSAGALAGQGGSSRPRAAAARFEVDHLPFGSLAILGQRTHSFASHPYGWFAFVVDLKRPGAAEKALLQGNSARRQIGTAKMKRRDALHLLNSAPTIGWDPHRVKSENARFRVFFADGRPQPARSCDGHRIFCSICLTPSFGRDTVTPNESSL